MEGAHALLHALGTALLLVLSLRQMVLQPVALSLALSSARLVALSRTELLQPQQQQLLQHGRRGKQLLLQSYGSQRVEVLAVFTAAVLLFFVAVLGFLHLVGTMLKAAATSAGLLSDVLLLGVGEKGGEESAVSFFEIVAAVLLLLIVQVSGILVYLAGREENKALASSRSKRKVGRAVVVEDLLATLPLLLRASLASFFQITSTALDLILNTLVIIYLFSRCLSLVISLGRFLLQATPIELKPLLDQATRDASNVEGVLELIQERFWTLKEGVHVGTLIVRVRFDADETAVLSSIHKIFAPLVSHLTVEIAKDTPVELLVKGSLPTFHEAYPSSSATVAPGITDRFVTKDRSIETTEKRGSLLL